MLPEIKNVNVERNNFPTKWQTVIFRNYRMAPDKNIAKILGCTVSDVACEAARMGLRTGDTDPAWLERGYITLIRNNWMLLPYDQLMELIEFDEARLDFTIANEDFLWVKLGSLKYECEEVKYSPLTENQIAETEEIAKLVREFDTSDRKMFDFFTDRTDTEPKYVVSPEGGTRIVHGFLTPCGDAFLDDTRSHLPDVLLDCYARQSVKVLFVHGVLSKLSPYRFDPTQSEGYEIRREHLRDLIKRAALRGIKIYIYFDEPRALPADVFERYGKPEMKGNVTANGSVCMCMTASEEPREYLYSATKDLFEAIPEIGGIFNITMSEYPTHCTTGPKGTSNCPNCKDLPCHTLPVLVNNIMHKAIRDAGSDAEVISYTWAWAPSRKWTNEDVENGMRELHPEISVMQVSENSLPVTKGGITSPLADYSISNPGPSEFSAFLMKTAAKYGHKVYAKVQVSNSWELSAVPYMPVFDIELEHLKNLHNIGVDNYMLTWTLGGYPSITFDMVADYMKDPDGFVIDTWYEKHFGKDGEAVHKAIKLFCEGFREFPYSSGVTYFSPKTRGPANLWSLEPDGRKSTMVNWSFDDYKQWMGPYNLEVYLDQMSKMLVKWDEALEILEGAANNEAGRELLLYAKFATLLYHSDVIHTNYTRVKSELPASKDEMLRLFEEERDITKKLLELMPKSSLIGFETSNHYFFTERDYIEKLIQLDQMEEELKKM